MSGSRDFGDPSEIDASNDFIAGMNRNGDGIPAVVYLASRKVIVPAKIRIASACRFYPGPLSQPQACAKPPRSGFAFCARPPPACPAWGGSGSCRRTNVEDVRLTEVPIARA